MNSTKDDRLDSNIDGSGVERSTVSPSFNPNEIGRDMQKLSASIAEKNVWTGVSDVFTLKKCSKVEKNIQ